VVTVAARALARVTGPLQPGWQALTVDRLVVTVSGTIIAWNSVLPQSLTTASASQLIPIALSLVNLAAISYAFLPRIYPAGFDTPIEDHRSLRYSLTAYVFVLAAYWYLWLLGLSAGGPSLVAVGPSWLFMIYLFGGIGLFALLVGRVESRTIFDPGHLLTHPIERLSGGDTGDELRALRATDWSRTAVRIMVPVAGSAIYLCPAWLLGALIGTLNMYYPILEVAALGAILADRVVDGDRRLLTGTRMGDLFDAAGEFDAGFYRQLRVASSPRAWGAFALAIVASLFALLPLLVDLRTSSPTVVSGSLLGAYAAALDLGTGAAIGYAAEKTGDALVALALRSTPLLVVCYGLWYWSHVVRRLPSLLYQVGTANEAERFPASVAKPAVSRPRGYLLPVAVVVTAWLSSRFTWGEPFLAIPVVQTEPGFLALWSLGVAALVWTVVQTWRQTPRAPTSTARELLVPFVVQYLVMSDLLLDELAVAWQVLALFVCLAFLYYLDAVRSFVAGASGRRRLLRSGLVGAGALLVSSVVLPLSVSAVVGVVVPSVFVLGEEMEALTE